MTLRFGTDGVRGVANAQLSPEFVLALGRAAALAFGASTCAIGRDPRRSGDMLFGALAAGLASQGVDVIDLGVVPTPAVAHWARTHNQPGAMISASHNPFADNGVKFFAPGGRKLTDTLQHDIEARLDELLAPRQVDSDNVPVGAAVGTVTRDDAGRSAYVNHLVGDLLDGRDLAGMHVVVDAANGAASRVVADVLVELGATLTLIGDDPNGTNINDGFGSTHPAALQQAVVAFNAQLGLALDGDADRLVAVDEHGKLVDGDALMAVFALDLAAQGNLADNRIVATVMSNLGLKRALEPAGIDVVTCPVGDRHVLAALEEHNLNLGGEQSGHLIFTDFATTGDGLLAGVLLADLVKRAQRPLSDLASVVTPLPQVLINVPLTQPTPDLTERIAASIDAAEADLGPDGRVLIRLSGTEPLARVMVEALDADQARHVAATLVDAVRATQG